MPGIVYTAGSGINISSSDQISVKNDVARVRSTYAGSSGSYVVNSSNQSLKVYQADRATNDSTGQTIASQQWVISQGYGTGTGGGNGDFSNTAKNVAPNYSCLLYTSPSPRDRTRSRMPSSA